MKTVLRTQLVCLLALPLSSCGPENKAVRISGTSYYFPDQHISAFIAPEDSGSGELYVRLIPPGDYYWLVYSSVRANRPNSQGAGVPTIPHITNRFVELKVLQSEVGPIVCQRNPTNDHSAYMRYIFSCGFRIVDAGVPWTVIIPGDLAASAPALKRRAHLTLQDYRREGLITKAEKVVAIP